MQQRSDMFKQTSSTPIVRKQIVRESLGRIKANTVSGMVQLFSQRQQSVINERSSEADLTPPRAEKTILTQQISFFNDLSPIIQASEYDSKLNSTDSGYNSIGFRQRSKSCASSSINRPQNIIESYAKYPNFKWSYLKYFGEDPKEYLSRYDIDYDTICDSSTGPKTIAGNNDVSNGCVKADDVEFNVMRKRSQSCNAKTLSEVTNVHHRVDQNSKVREITSSVEKSANCFQQEDLNEGSTKQTHELNLASGDSNVVCRKRKSPPESFQITTVKDLRSRIQKSIDSYENNCKVRRLNRTSFKDAE